MSRGTINFLLFLGWIAALAALIFRIGPGWLAFSAIGVLLAVGILTGRNKANAAPPTLRSNLPRSTTAHQPGTALGQKRSYDDIIEMIRQKSFAERTDAEHRLLEGHIFQAYFYHQGGFDYYFAHVDEPERWAHAVTALLAIGHDEVTRIFHQAAKRFATFDHGSGEGATTAYLAEMRELDARFRAALPDMEEPLRQLARKI